MVIYLNWKNMFFDGGRDVKDGQKEGRQQNECFNKLVPCSMIWHIGLATLSSKTMHRHCHQYNHFGGALSQRMTFSAVLC